MTKNLRKFGPVVIYFRPSEKKKIQVAADSTGLSLSSFCRVLLGKVLVLNTNTTSEENESKTSAFPFLFTSSFPQDTTNTKTPIFNGGSHDEK